MGYNSVRPDMQEEFGETIQPGTEEFGRYMTRAAEATRARNKARQDEGPPYRSMKIRPHRWYHFSDKCCLCHATVRCSGWFAIHPDESGWGRKDSHWKVCVDCMADPEMLKELFEETFYLPPHIHDVANFIRRHKGAEEANEWRRVAFQRQEKHDRH